MLSVKARLGLLLLAATFALAAHATPASADMEVCNRQDEHHINFALIWDEGSPIINETWHAKGWFAIPPKSCFTLTRGVHKSQVVILSIRTVWRGEGSPRIANYPMAKIVAPANFLRFPGWDVIERLYCVKRGDFHRTTKTLAEMATCPPGYYSQLFNISGLTFTYENNTLNLD